MAEHAVLRFPIAADLGPLRDQVRAFAAAREQHLTEMARLIETIRRRREKSSRPAY
ncbi:hypothetical protein [Nonomuraea sp. SBT364]|uniref:hypothetical protein n=1 Tax=Nonomuraea sp. SBT364 TaxID=1580530 RepID=UPI000A95A297|nr:hypothetical protein [Nonomuraea sp. SBT364]